MGAAFLDRRAWLGGLLLGLLLSGCGSVRTYQAPVEDRLGGVAKAAAVVSDPAAMAPKPAPGAENAGKSGYYTVKPGDTLIRIGLDSGQSFRDIARWKPAARPASTPRQPSSDGRHHGRGPCGRHRGQHRGR